MLTLILDTNVILDWLVFRNQSCSYFTQAVKANRVSIMTHGAACHELRRVLNYPVLKLDVTQQDEVYAAYRSMCFEAMVPAGFTAKNLMLPEGFPNCRDPDDQLFLALAMHTKADALVTRDRAVLALRKKARKFGVAILDVEQLRARVTVIDADRID